MRNEVMTIAYDYLINDGDLDTFAVLDYLGTQGIEPMEQEVEAIALMVDDILTELSLVRSIKLLWDVKRYNRLVYGD